VDPYEYLVGKLAQVEVALEDFESVAEESPQDQATLAGLRVIEARLLRALALLERDAASTRTGTG
jgi:hypothetical protein